MKKYGFWAILAGLFVLFCPFFLFRQGFIPGMTLAGFDTVRLGLPFEVFIRDTFARYHDIALWLPQIFTGVPLIDSANTQIFYPPAMLLLLLPVPAWAYETIQVLLHVFAAGFGMYLFAGALGAGKPASVFAGFVYMSSGVMLSQCMNGILSAIQAAALIPYVFYFIKKGVDSKKAIHFINAGIFLALQNLSIMFQMAFYTYIAAAAYLIFEMAIKGDESGTQWIKLPLWLFLAGFAAFLFSAVQFLPTLHYIAEYSIRPAMTYENFTSYSFFPIETIRLFLPRFFGTINSGYWGMSNIPLTNFYIGLLPYLLLPFAFIRGANQKRAFFFAVLGATALVLSYGGNTPLFQLLYHVPVFNKFRSHDRLLFGLNMAMAVLSAFSFDSLISDKNTGPVRKISKAMLSIYLMLAVSLSALFITGAMNAIVEKLHVITRGMAMPAGALSSSLTEIGGDIAAFSLLAFLVAAVVFIIIKYGVKNPLILLLVLLAAHFADTYRINSVYLPYSPIKEIIAEKSPLVAFFSGDKSQFRVDLNRVQKIMNQNIFYSIETVDGYHGNLPEKIAGLSTSGAFAMPWTKRMLNVKYYVSREDMPGLEKVYDSGVKIFLDKKALPRFYAVDKVVLAENDADAVNKFRDGAAWPDRVILKEDPGLDKNGPALKQDVKVLMYSPNKIQLAVTVNKKCVLINSSMYYDSWKAKVDGRKERLMEANYLVQGVVLKPGAHTVELYMERKEIYYGLLLALAGALLYALLLVRKPL